MSFISNLTELARTFHGQSNGLGTIGFVIESPTRISSLKKSAARLGVQVREIGTVSYNGHQFTKLLASTLS